MSLARQQPAPPACPGALDLPPATVSLFIWSRPPRTWNRTVCALLCVTSVAQRDVPGAPPVVAGISRLCWPNTPLFASSPGSDLRHLTFPFYKGGRDCIYWVVVGE